MNFLRVVLCGVMVFFTGGCVVARADGDSLDNAIIDSAVTKEEIIITVPSNGCTDAASFHVEVVEGESDVRLLFRRLEPDSCKSWLPDGEQVTFKKSALGIHGSTRIIVCNPQQDGQPPRGC